MRRAAENAACTKPFLYNLLYFLMKKYSQNNHCSMFAHQTSLSSAGRFFLFSGKLAALKLPSGRNVYLATSEHYYLEKNICVGCWVKCAVLALVISKVL